MNQDQYEKARKVLSEDCEITIVLMDSYGRTCAIGGLAKAAGVPADVLMSGDTRYEDSETAICDTYGLDKKAIDDLMGINDTQRSQKFRQEATVRYLDKLAIKHGLCVVS